MRQELTSELAEQLILSRSIADLDFNALIKNIDNDKMLRQYCPDGICQIDPRNGNLVVYNSARAKRLHTTTEPDTASPSHQFCPICEGKSTEILDVAKHSDGFSFVNKNIYPIFHTIQNLPDEDADYFSHQDLEHKGRASYGFHLLQWTSSIHDRDWHNMPSGDALICFKQLANLERTLLWQPTDFMSRSITQVNENMVSGYVSIIKNYGAAAGASLTHGHQQITYSNILPQRFFNNLRFKKRHNYSFSQFMLNENPNNLIIKDYGKVVVITAYFMKRPLDTLLILKDTKKRYLHQLSSDELQQMSQAIQDCSRAIIGLMEEMDLPPAYNMIVNNGPGCGLYIELLAQTQKMGGYEHIGLFVCQSSPLASAAQMSARIKKNNNLE